MNVSSLESSPSISASETFPSAVTAKWCYLLAVALSLAALPALPTDLTLARALMEGRLPGDLRRVLTWSEAFAHGVGVALIAMAALWLDAGRRRRWPRVLFMAYGAGISADVVKLFIGRYRPRYFFALDLSSPSVDDTFAGFMRSLVDGLDHSVQSFPSAHTATACGLAIGLSRIYPRARWLFLCLATLAAAQRLDAGAHFLSDVFAGAGLGVFVATLSLDTRVFGGWFDRLEKRASHAAVRTAQHD